MTCKNCMPLIKLKNISKIQTTIDNDENSQNTEKSINKTLQKPGGSVKAAVGSDLSLVAGDYHGYGETVVMEMASIYVRIRHVFCSLAWLKNDRSTFSSNITYRLKA